MAEFTINYGALLSLSNEIEATANSIRSLYYSDYDPAASKLYSSMTGGLTYQFRKATDSLGDVIHNTYQHLHHERDMMRSVNEMCVSAERQVLAILSNQVVVSAGGFASGLSLSPSFADERDKEKADKEAAAQAKADADAKAEEEAKQRRERLLELLARFFPETYAAYLKKLSDAERDAFLAELKETDPELYELAMAELQRQEEAAKAAEEAAAALGGSDGLVGSGLSDSLGSSDFGGGGGLDLGDSGGGGLDFGGSGGLGDDWSSDLLGDTLGDDLLGAQDELAGFADADLPSGVASGFDVLASEGDLAADVAPGFWDEYGPQLAAFVQAYGVQTAAALGGAAALYATREQTIEAVAHVAEFVSCKCKPAMLDVMNQVSGATKKTRVNLGDAKSRVVGVARGEEAGGLFG